MATARSGLITSALALALLSGCTQAQPTMAPPQPSPTCTPEAGGKAYPCSPYYYDQMIAKDKLYTEAEAVYRKFFAEESRIYHSGGVTDATPVLLETTTGEYLSDSLAIYRDLRKTGSTADGESKLVWIKRVVGESREGSVVALRTCTDSLGLTLRTAKGKKSRGAVVEETGYYLKEGGALKLAIASSKVVEKCS